MFLLLACVSEPPEYVYGIDVADIEFVLYDTDMGVYPNNSLARDPNNPFGEYGVDGPSRWEIYPTGAVPGTSLASPKVTLPLRPAGPASWVRISSPSSIGNQPVSALAGILWTSGAATVISCWKTGCLSTC